MSKPFDMELFLTGVLIGAHATRHRHLRQVKIFRLQSQSAGSGKTLGLGKRSMWCGFLRIA